MYQTDGNEPQTVGESLFDQAINFSQAGQFTEAITLLDELLVLEPDCHQVWNERGVLLERLENYEEAIASYDRVLSLTPSFYQAWYNRGNAFFHLEQYEEAIASYDQALSEQPSYYEAWNNRALALEQLERYEEAIASYDKLLEGRDNYYEAWYNRAIVLEKLNRDQEAITSYAQALSIRPGYYEAWYNRAIVLERLNLYEEAIASYKQAVAVQPNFVNAWNNLGIALEKVGNYAEAIKCYDRAIFLQPEFHQAWFNLGNALRLLDRFGEAINCYQQAIQYRSDYAEAYCNLGVALEAQHLLEEAIAYYQKALEIQPDFPEVRRNLSLVYLKLVPRWHFAMMNDQERGDRYEEAIRKIVTPESVVLDIGSGSGLLALMAARAGAKQVITCETVAPIAAVASEIVKLNNFEDKIQVIPKKSFNLEVGTDLPAPADILVSEIFDVGLLGESAIPAIKHARTYLLTPNAKILPKSATIYAALVESQELFNEDRVEMVNGFDLSPFNQFASISTYQQKPLERYTHQWLSEPVSVFDFNFEQDIPAEENKTLDFTIVNSGTCHGIAFWFRLWLDDEIYIDTSPIDQGSSTHWMQAIQLWRSPIKVETNQTLQITANHNSINISFELVT